MKKLHKSRTNRLFMGVCGGIGETFGINPIVVRVLFAALSVFTGSLLLWVDMLLGLFLPMGDYDYGDDGPTVSRRRYKPEDPPFDISSARDVDFRGHEE